MIVARKLGDVRLPRSAWPAAPPPQPARTWAHPSLKTFAAFRVVKHALKTVHASRVIDASAGRDVPRSVSLLRLCRPGALTRQIEFFNSPIDRIGLLD